MEAYASKGKYRPLHTSAFYEMRVALGVLFAVLFLCLLPKPAIMGGMISLIFGTINSIAIIWQIRSGELITPKLNPQDGEASQDECRYIERSLAWSIGGTCALSILIFVCICLHRLTGIGMVATVAAFNIYGWVTYSWWREVWQMVARYKEDQKRIAVGKVPIARPVPLTAALPRMSPVATPEPLALHIGKS